MKIENASTIVNFLSQATPQGASPATIARKTKLPLSEVKVYLENLPKTFIRVSGNAQYTINKFSSQGANNVYQEVADVLRSQSAKNRLQIVFVCLIWIAIHSSVLATTLLNSF